MKTPLPSPLIAFSPSKIFCSMVAALALLVLATPTMFAQVIFAADFTSSGTGQLQDSSASVGAFTGSPALPNSNVTIEDIGATTALKVTRDTTVPNISWLPRGIPNPTPRYVPVPGDVINVTFDYYVSDSGSSGVTSINPGGTTSQTYAGIYIRNTLLEGGQIRYINDVGGYVSSSETISLDTWYSFELIITYTTGSAANTLSGTYSGYVTPDGGSKTTLFENQQMRDFSDSLAIRGSTGNQPKGFGDQTSITYWNNMSLEVVPEPHTVLLLGLGLGALALRRRTRS